MTRRELLLGVAVLPAVESPQGPCADAKPEAKLAPPGEPGAALIVEGQVFRPDGRTPAPGVIVYAYQTDATGLYTRPGSKDIRLHGWMKTSVEGRFRFDTIRPAPYPNGTIPAHIHFQLWGGGYEPQWTDELLFADDPLVKERERRESASLGIFANVHEVKGGRVEHNIRLKERGTRFEESILHGLRACGMMR